MKLKNSFIVLMILFTIYSCVKLDDHSEELILNPKTAELHIGQKVRFGTNKDDVEWESKNKFIGTISSNGTFNAKHIGKTKVIAQYGDEKKEAAVIVIPQVTGFPEPVIKFGVSKNEIIELEKRKLLANNPVTLIYDSESADVETMYYLFEGNRCTYAIIRYKEMDKSKLEDLLTFYNERYEYYGQDKSDQYFVDQRKKVIVAVSTEEVINARYTAYKAK